MKKSDYARMEAIYNKAFFMFIVYNGLSATVLCAAVNHLFRNKRANMSTAMVATVPLFAAFWANVQLSDCLKNYFINNTARRLGHGHALSSKWGRYPRNVEF